MSKLTRNNEDLLERNQDEQLMSEFVSIQIYYHLDNTDVPVWILSEQHTDVVIMEGDTSNKTCINYSKCHKYELNKEAAKSEDISSIYINEMYYHNSNSAHSETIVCNA